MDDERDGRVEGGRVWVGDSGSWPRREMEMLVRLRSRVVLAPEALAAGMTSSATSCHVGRPSASAAARSRSSSSCARWALSSSRRRNIYG